MSLDDAFTSVNCVFLDTAPVIYYVEQHPRYSLTVRSIFRKLTNGDFLAVTSPVTLAECLIKPMQENLLQLQQDFTELITDGANTSFVLIDERVSRKAAELRVSYGIKLPDALQIAVALIAGCDAFLTNDNRLKRVTDLQILVIEELSNNG